MTCDTIVAGAGIWGCTVARCLAEAGRKVLVLEIAEEEVTLLKKKWHEFFD